MQFGSKLLCSALVFAATLPVMAAPRVRRGPTSPRLFSKRNAAPRPAAKPAAQRGIEPERATQIQAALIKQGYMTGEPSGKWDPSTQAALEKMQGDNGWQTKIVPDSRAIIKLGLGPTAASAAEPASSTFASTGSEKPLSTPLSSEPESAQK